MAGIKSRDDDLATLQRTVQHLVDNGVDLDKYPMSMGPLLKFDPQKEVFPDSPQATKMVTREYREGFVCPTGRRGLTRRAGFPERLQRRPSSTPEAAGDYGAAFL